MSSVLLGYACFCLLGYDEMRFEGLVEIFFRNVLPQSSVCREYGGNTIHFLSRRYLCTKPHGSKIQKAVILSYLEIPRTHLGIISGLWKHKYKVITREFEIFENVFSVN
jgi:hypothetical protein